EGHRSGWRPYLQNPSAALDRRNGRPSETRGYFTNAIWQDHLSTTREEGRLVFETQPYLTVEDVETDPDIAWLRSQGWEIAISTDSPHFPGWTIMVRLTPPLRVKSSAPPRCVSTISAASPTFPSDPHTSARLTGRSSRPHVSMVTGGLHAASYSSMRPV